VERLMRDGRAVMRELGGIVAGVLVRIVAEVGGGTVEREVARRWEEGEEGEEGKEGVGWRDRFEWDRRIVFGDEGTGERSRL